MSKKLTIFFVALLVTVFTVSSAMAYTLNSRSEEMTAESTCDFAGTITLEFAPADQAIIAAYLTEDLLPLPAGDGIPDNNAVLIRVSLSGTDIEPTSDVPVLCRDIAAGVAHAPVLGAALVAIPNDVLTVALDRIDVEVSDIAPALVGDGVADILAYVYGEATDQYFEIYITAMQPPVDTDNPVWIKIGLDEEVTGADGLGDDELSTAICADVHDFGGLSKLTVSIDNTPSTLVTTTSDNQIGHFLVADIDLRDCNKAEEVSCASTSSIELCPITIGSGGQSVTCDIYQYCMVAEGDFPLSETIDINIYSDGANGAATQAGVYLYSVALRTEAGGLIPPANYTIVWDVAPAACSIVGSAVTFAQTTQATITIDTAEFTGFGDELQFCIEYMVDPAVAEQDSNVRFWALAETLPCGTLFDGMQSAALLVECGSTPSCMYFPYVVSGINPWQAGLVVTNIGTNVAAADMDVTFTLTDATGAVFTYNKTDFTQVVWAGFLDSILSEFSGTPAAGAGWLMVQGNFALDGYSFLTDGNFGAGTLARPMVACPGF